MANLEWLNEQILGPDGKLVPQATVDAIQERIVNARAHLRSLEKELERLGTPVSDLICRCHEDE